MESLNLPDSEITYYDRFFPVENSDRLLDSLIKHIQWKQNTIRFYGKESPVPRLEAWYGDPGMSYSYSGIQMDPLPWTEDLLEIKKIIEPAAKTTFNSVLINFYRNGKDRVAWHSDDEKELGEKPIIGSVSFGAERKFKLRHKKHRENGLRSEIVLKHGSFLLMSGLTQSHWSHEIPRTAKPLGPRVNLTYRKII